MRPLAFDLETALIRPGVLAPEIACLSWAESPDAKGLLVDLPAIRKFAETALKGDAVLVGANIAYDFGCLLAEWPDLLPLVWAKYERGEVRDVIIRQTLTAIAEGRLRDGELLARTGLRMTDGKGRMTSRYSLDVCVKEVLGRNDAKENDAYRLRYGELIGVPLAQWPEEARQYPVDDALNTLLVHLGQTDDHGKDAAAQAHTAFCLHLASMWGIRTDPERVAALKASLEEVLRTERAWAIFVKLMRPDGTKNMAAIRSAVEEAYGGSPPTTDKGGISTSRETLAESSDEVLERFAEISKTEKLLTYIPSLEEASKAPLNVRCNVLLSTGRASYEGVIQLLPRKGGVRECFKARGIFSSVDYAAIELSALAQVCLNMGLESKLADAINAGMDPHSILGARLAGVSYEEFMKGRKTIAEFKELRQASKACFALDTKVLTGRGWVAIVDVQPQDQLWDGEQWVNHDGVVFSGVQKTLRRFGVEATPDHGIYVGSSRAEWREVLTSHSLLARALSSATLPCSGGCALTRSPVGQKGSMLLSGAHAALSSSPLDSSCETDIPSDADTATKSRSDRRGICALPAQCQSRSTGPDSSIDCTLQSTGAQTQETRISRTTEGVVSASIKSGWTTSQSSWFTFGHSPGGTNQICSSTGSTTIAATSQVTYDSPRLARTSETECRCQTFEDTSPVFDIVNAGPRHRFTILSSEGPLLVANCNFGYPGMMSPPTFVEAQRKAKASVCEWFHRDGFCGEAKVSYYKDRTLKAPLCARCILEASKLRDFYTRTWSEVPRYWKMISQALVTTDALDQFVSGRTRGGLHGPSAANTLFQGLAADGAKLAVRMLTEAMYMKPESPLYGSRLCVFAHDETIIDIPDLGVDHVDAAAREQARIMVEAMKVYIPDVAVTAEPALMRYWTKDADKKLDEEGRLIPWDS